MPASNFLVVNQGLAAAAAATPTGPFVNITEFKLTDDYTSTPLVTDTALPGNVVFFTSPTSYSYYDSTTIQINLEVPAAAGPFDYGGVGLYMPGGVLFGWMSYGSLRTKSSSSTAGFANTTRIKVLVRLAQGPAIFNFAPNPAQTVLEVVNFQVVNSPNDNPTNPMVIVHEPNDFQESVTIFKDTATHWNISNYSAIGTTTPSAAPSSTELTAPFFGTLFTPASSRGRYLIQTPGGYIRQITSVTGNVATFSSSINTAALVGQSISVYQSDRSLLTEIYTATSTLQAQMASMVFFFNATLSGTAFTVSAGTFPPVGTFSVKFASANPASSTLNVNGSGARPLKDSLGNALAAGAISANESKTVVSDGTSYFVLDVSTYMKRSDFTGANQQLTGTQGFQVLPGNRVKKWGYSPQGNVIAGVQTIAVTFLTPFATAPIPSTLMITVQDEAGQGNLVTGWNSLTNSGVNITYWETGPSVQNITIHWSIEGY